MMMKRKIVQEIVQTALIIIFNQLNMKIISSITVGILVAFILYLLKAPIWAVVGFGWMAADHSILYLRLIIK